MNRTHVENAPGNRKNLATAGPQVFRPQQSREAAQKLPPHPLVALKSDSELDCFPDCWLPWQHLSPLAGSFVPCNRLQVTTEAAPG